MSVLYPSQRQLALAVSAFIGFVGGKLGEGEKATERLRS